jgi:hypothetical protein
MNVNLQGLHVEERLKRSTFTKGPVFQLFLTDPLSFLGDSATFERPFLTSVQADLPHHVVLACEGKAFKRGNSKEGYGCVLRAGIGPTCFKPFSEDCY